MNQSGFIGLQTSEDPQNFLREIKKIFEVMQVTGNIDYLIITLYTLNLIELRVYGKSLKSNYEGHLVSLMISILYFQLW